MSEGSYLGKEKLKIKIVIKEHPYYQKKLKCTFQKKLRLDLECST